MLWSRSDPPKLPLAPASVPDTQALRKAALESSWKRDRRVGKRRLVMRWVLWAFFRYGIPFSLLLAATLAAWFSLHTGLHQTPAVPTEPIPRTVAAPVQTPSVPVPEPSLDTDTDIHDNMDVMQLRLERSLSSSSALPSATTPLTHTVKPVNNPSLKPENWLHSKEP
jgi:hypothetical protein